MDTAAPNFSHIVHPVWEPASSRDGGTPRRVVVAGGGPVGLATALTLARHGIPVLVIEADRTVCVGSRAICLSRRTFEILDRLGALQPFLDKGLPWTGGRSFHRGDQVLHFTMPSDGDQRLAPMTNIQQYYIEQFLLDQTALYPDLIEICWGTRVERIVAGQAGVTLALRTDATACDVTADYLVACDGARSLVRQELGLRLDGTAYEGRYVIVDIEIALDLPTERLAWFDPPSNPGRTMLMHRQPDDLWRLDYQLHDSENSEEMIVPEKVVPVVEAHLAMMGVELPWRLIWSSTYRAAALSLDRYRHGRVLFAGDAAHLVPIFGVRGLNSGFDDAFNLGWKLASVIGSIAPDTLLDSYSQERRLAWQVNVASAMKSTEFMAPPSRGYELMRDAVLSLARSRPALATLINPRQSSAIAYEGSSLNTVTRDETSFSGGPAPGAPVVECPLSVGGEVRHLTQLLGYGFTLVVYGDGKAAELAQREADGLRRTGIDLTLLHVCASADEGDAGAAWRLRVDDPHGRFATLYDAQASEAYLFRPDGHVCARWRKLIEGDLAAAVDTALGKGKPH